jgi:integrase
MVAAAPTFRECAERYIKENDGKWSPKHGAQWPSSLQTYAYPTIGHLRIAEILPSHIYDLLQIWIEKRETSNRVCGRIETVIAKNVDIDDLDFRNPAELTKQLREKLPKRPKHKPRHHPALPYAEAPAFMASLAGAAGGAAEALRFLIYTVCRTNEVLGARWAEIDRPAAVWRIPGERMKMAEDHCVPLTAPALAIPDRSREDIPNFRPLNTPEGQGWTNALIDKVGGVDLIILDNIMSLTVGDMKDPEPWQQTIPWALSLTRRHVGQIWIHHTGHDETRSYGDKSREWQMDTVAHQQRQDDQKRDLPRLQQL